VREPGVLPKKSQTIDSNSNQDVMKRML